MMSSTIPLISPPLFCLPLARIRISPIKSCFWDSNQGKRVNVRGKNVLPHSCFQILPSDSTKHAQELKDIHAKELITIVVTFLFTACSKKGRELPTSCGLLTCGACALLMKSWFKVTRFLRRGPYWGLRRPEF